MSVYGGGWRSIAAVGLGLFVTGAHAASESWIKDPFRIEHKTSPAPEKRWEPTGPLPSVAVPAASGTISSDGALTLPELTEFVLRNNPRTRQAWFAARAAAAALGVAEGDDLPSITGNWSFLRSHPVSGTSGLISPWLTRWGPSVTLNHVLFDFGLGEARANAVE